jgi:hypothetical protein
MDLETTIIGIAVIFICIIPFVVMNRSTKKRERQLLQSIFKLAQKSDCTVSLFDHWNKSAIGVDESIKVIFFTKATDNHEMLAKVNLSEIQKCRVINVTRTVNNNGFHYIEKLELTLTYHDKNKAESILEFYNANSDSLSLNGELQLIEKWQKIISELIKGNN